jgi:outer membrane protein assembly factor BamB
MKISKGKTTAIAITIFLMLSMAASLILVPAANAHTPPIQIKTYAFIMAVPNPIGVGQYTHIYMWIDKVFDSAAFVNDYRHHNYKLTITKPNGDTEVKTWDTIWDTTSSQGYNYAPDQVGEYTLKFEYPEQAINAVSHSPTSAYVNDTYAASSATTTLIVQEEPIIGLPDSYPLPTEYWTRPIYGENPGWWTISSDWLGTGSPQLTTYSRYIRDGVGPTTSHIMWTKPLQAGGVVGGDNFDIQGDTYFEGSAYISRYRNPIIVNGKLYYKPPVGFSSGSGGPTTCVDLRTGELIWSRNDVPSLSFAMIYATHQPNQHGVMQPVLCTSNFARAFDADTGNPLFNFTNVPSGASALGPNGEHLRWVVTNCGNSTHPDWYLAQWNSTRPFFGTGLTPSVAGNIPANAPITPAPVGTNNYWNGSMWVSNAVRTAQGYAAIQWTAYDWNVSIPWLNVMGNQTESTVEFANGTIALVKGYSATGSNPNAANPSSQLFAFTGDMIICRNGSIPSSRAGLPSLNKYTYFAVNLNASKGALGSILWWNTVTPDPVLRLNAGVADPTARVFTESTVETTQWIGYSMDTGKKLWGPTAGQGALDYYGYFFPGLYECDSQAPGRIYSAGMSGIVYCYDITTGDVLWTYGNGGEGNSTNSGFQVPGPYPTFVWAVANGIVYTITTEHTIQTPIYKGAMVRAINATDGTEIWTLSNYNGAGISACALADGFATFMNGYDNLIYVVGRGPSATTVTIQNDIITHGDSVVVKGTVTDISAGTTQNEQAARFPNGVPVISDADMTDWMGYIYQQKPLPTDVTGVEVVISVLDPNNNCYEVARATSDASGYFGCTFEPLVPGFYKVIATFEGSEGYWGSSAETFINVEEAPAATPVPTPVPQEPVGTYFTISTVLIIAAIAIVAFLLLRKR